MYKTTYITQNQILSFRNSPYILYTTCSTTCILLWTKDNNNRQPILFHNFFRVQRTSQKGP